MSEESKETFGNFDFASALELLDLFPYLKWEPQITPLQITDSLKVNLNELVEAVR
jgi:hypothetical protein